MNGGELDRMAPWVVLAAIAIVLTAPIWYPIDRYRAWRKRRESRRNS